MGTMDRCPPLLITIDGPAGAGKTTLSRRLAARLQYVYVDTGALYRAVAVAARTAGVQTDDDAGLKALCDNLRIRFSREGEKTRLLLNDDDVTRAIREPEISMRASAVSARPVVRRFLLSLQRDMGLEKRAVFEGRDMGTVVFPDADVKFFLSASLKARAARRYHELKDLQNLGYQSLEAVEQDMAQRDNNDSTRATAPLKPAQDAVFIDSTRLTLDEALDTMLTHIRLVRPE